VNIDGPCLAKIMGQVPPGESSAVARTILPLLEAAEQEGIKDREQLAYILATVKIGSYLYRCK